MISDRLKRQIKKLRQTGNAEVYVVWELYVDAALCLVVPQGGRNMPVANPITRLHDPEPELLGEDQWERITQPMLIWVVPQGEPDLHAIPDARPSA